MAPGPRARAEPRLSDVRNLRRLRTALRSGLRGITGAPLVFVLSVTSLAFLTPLVDSVAVAVLREPPNPVPSQ